MKDINKIREENNQRLDTLFKSHYDWLIGIGYNITKNREVAVELVSELFLYLGEKGNPNLWFADSFNLLYCRYFIKSRFLNLIKVNSRMERLPDDWDTIDEEYDSDFDAGMDTAYNQIKDELNDLGKTRMWTSAKLAELYFYSDKTLEGVSNDIGVSKSTSYLHVKKIRKHLKNKIGNPFKKT